MVDKMNNFYEFIKTIDQTYDKYSFQWRYGQTIMNVLHGANPAKYNEIVSTEYDCYYNDSITKITLEKLEREWNDS